MDSASGPAALIATAEVLLGRAGFVTTVEQLPGADCDWLLAENALFVVAVAASKSFEELRNLESVVTESLLGRLGGIEQGAKRWDAYVVLVTPDGLKGDEDRERVELVYNTRGVRRIVGTSVDETEESLRDVLAPFLPLEAQFSSAFSDLDAALIDALIVNGVSERDAARYVHAFRQKGELRDV